uniref:Pherophorin domain-containing protein n=2 Tax=Chlamydomonas euryale TaxID=1486919 RepID=A0A6U2I237_9CHLO
MRHLLQSQDYVATPQDTGCFPGVNVGKVDYPAYSANLPNLRLSDCINECQDEDGCQFLRWSPSYEAFCHVRGPPDLRTGRTADARQQLCFPVSNQMFNGTLPHFCVWESDVTGIESARPPASNPTDCALSCASPFIDCAYFFWNPVDRTCSLRHSPYSPSSNAGTSGYSRNGQVCFQTTAFMTAALPPDASQAGQGPSPAPPPPTGDLLPGASPLPTPSTFPAPASSAFPFVGCAANVSSPYSFVVTNITSGDNIPGGDVMCGELRTSLACDARDPCCSTDLSEIRLLINDVCEGALFSVQFGETVSFCMPEASDGPLILPTRELPACTLGIPP